jgi:hypothetical protein
LVIRKKLQEEKEKALQGATEVAPWEPSNKNAMAFQSALHSSTVRRKPLLLYARTIYPEGREWLRKVSKP